MEKPLLSLCWLGGLVKAKQGQYYLSTVMLQSGIGVAGCRNVSSWMPSITLMASPHLSLYTSKEVL